MERKLNELEHVFNRLMNVPKRRIQLETQTKQIDAELTQMENTLVQANILKTDELVNENKYLLERISQMSLEIGTMKRKVEEYQSEISLILDANDKLKKSEKKMIDALLRSRGAIRVMCRIKPTDVKVGFKHNDRLIDIEGKKFTMNEIFGQKATQEDIFEDLKLEVQSVMDGYNICVFAYGQTGSGKTYTMEGIDENKGLIYRSLELLINMSNELKSGGYKVNYNLTCIEIYMETIKDLFTGNPVTITHENGAIKLNNSTSFEFKDLDEGYQAIQTAGKKRSIGATQCNLESSRSHSVFILNVVIEGYGEKRVGSLCLIDLAGSERLNKSKAEDQRLKETQFINKSLSALGNVITSIKRNESHIPFRDSKLTHLMQDFLCGKSRTSMIVNINPDNIDETICSLRFATKVSECNLGATSRNITQSV